MGTEAEVPGLYRRRKGRRFDARRRGISSGYFSRVSGIPFHVSILPQLRFSPFRDVPAAHPERQRHPEHRRRHVACRATACDQQRCPGRRPDRRLEVLGRGLPHPVGPRRSAERTSSRAWTFVSRSLCRPERSSTFWRAGTGRAAGSGSSGAMGSMTSFTAPRPRRRLAGLPIAEWLGPWMPGKGTSGATTSRPAGAWSGTDAFSPPFRPKTGIGIGFGCSSPERASRRQRSATGGRPTVTASPKWPTWRPRKNSTGEGSRTGRKSCAGTFARCSGRGAASRRPSWPSFSPARRGRRSELA